MNDSDIYLDNAATSFPKPDAVYDAVDSYQRGSGRAVSRGGYTMAVEAGNEVERGRTAIARLLNAESPSRIVYTFNGTDGLNLLLFGLLAENDHVVTTAIEHNSVLRPLFELQSSRQLKLSIADCDPAGYVDVGQLESALKEHAARLVVVSHASNVTGAVQPIAEIGRLAHQHGALFMVDAAQTAGHVPIDVQAMSIDLLATSGHKGLLGPLGTGIAYIREGLDSELRPWRYGGTGSQSDKPYQPQEMPARFEAGNLNAPGLLGLKAGVGYLQETGLDSLQQHGRELTARLLIGIGEIAGVTVVGPGDVAERVPVVSVMFPDFDVQDAAAILDAEFGICVRSGLHCAPLIHRFVSKDPVSGTLRISPGPFTTPDDIDAVLAALRSMTAF